MNTIRISPCGLDCRLCRAYSRERKACPGCWGDDQQKSISCLACKIKNCDQMQLQGLTTCADCSVFPCDLIKRLDKRYRTKYGTSPIGNLTFIAQYGTEKFLVYEETAYRCSSCGKLYCMHDWICPGCGLPRIQSQPISDYFPI